MQTENETYCPYSERQPHHRCPIMWHFHSVPDAETDINPQPNEQESERVVYELLGIEKRLRRHVCNGAQQ